MSCEHKSLDHRMVECAGPTSSNKGVIIDVWCMTCGKTGSLGIEPDDVEWDEESKEYNGQEETTAEAKPG